MIHMYVYTTFTHDSTCITVVYIRHKPWPAMSQPSEPRASLGGGSVDAAPLSLGGYGLQHPPLVQGGGLRFGMSERLAGNIHKGCVKYSN